MNIYELQERPPQQLERLLMIWEASVRATHHFLSDAEVKQIKSYVPQALQSVSHLIIAVNASNELIVISLSNRKRKGNWKAVGAIRNPNGNGQ